MISKFKKFIFLLKAKSKYNNETYNKESLNSFENRVYIDISQYDPNVPARLINNRINELYHSNKNNNQIILRFSCPHDFCVTELTKIMALKRAKIKNKNTIISLFVVANITF